YSSLDLFWSCFRSIRWPRGRPGQPTNGSHTPRAELGLTARTKMADIAIVGGGPSGAMCGEQLARAGHNVEIFDEHLAWEKPCGGGLTHKAIQTYPFLLNGPHPKKLIRSVELISSAGHRAHLSLDQPIMIYSRTVLNGLLLDRAVEAGCKVQRSRVTQIETSGPQAILSIGESRVEAE